MCKFCEESFSVGTTIGDKILKLSLDENNKKILKISIQSGGCGVTRPIVINYCPLCGKDLRELNCRDCSNYNIGDGVDDISICINCPYR